MKRISVFAAIILAPLTVFADASGTWEATFDTHFRFPDGETLSRPSTLRFLGREAVLDHLSDAGFTDIELFGHWDRRPFGPSEPEILVVAR